MSYCRWSSENFWSDVYVYASFEGAWITHVAGIRHSGEIPTIPPHSEWSAIGHEAVAAAYRARSAFLEHAERVPIGLPHDGETFSDPGPAECGVTLRRLQALGYHVPQYAIDSPLEEAAALLSPDPVSTDQGALDDGGALSKPICEEG